MTENMNMKKCKWQDWKNFQIIEKNPKLTKK